MHDQHCNSTESAECFLPVAITCGKEMSLGFLSETQISQHLCCQVVLKFAIALKYLRKCLPQSQAMIAIDNFQKDSVFALCIQNVGCIFHKRKKSLLGLMSL